MGGLKSLNERCRIAHCPSCIMERRLALLHLTRRRSNSSRTIRLEHGRRLVRRQAPLPRTLRLEHRHRMRLPLVVVRLVLQKPLAQATRMLRSERRLRPARSVAQWRRRQARLGTLRQLSRYRLPSAILNRSVVAKLLSLRHPRTRNHRPFNHLRYLLDHHNKARSEALVAWR
jgi:hypothetical protein